MPISSKMRCAAIPVLLCVVATNHCVRYFSLQQSSWGAGCGFGMFATVDYHGTRFFRAYLSAQETEEPAIFRSSFPELDLRGRVLPTEDNLTEFATVLRDAHWTLEGGPELMPVATTAVSAGTVDPCFSLLNDRPVGNDRLVDGEIEIDRVRLELWGINFIPRERLIRAHTIRRVEVGSP